MDLYWIADKLEIEIEFQVFGKFNSWTS